MQRILTRESFGVGVYVKWGLAVPLQSAHAFTVTATIVHTHPNLFQFYQGTQSKFLCPVCVDDVGVQRRELLFFFVQDKLNVFTRARVEQFPIPRLTAVSWAILRALASNGCRSAEFGDVPIWRCNSKLSWKSTNTTFFEIRREKQAPSRVSHGIQAIWCKVC